MPEGGDFGYEVFDLSGKLLSNKPISEYDIGTYNESVNISYLSKGIYIVNYTLNGEKHSIKLANE